MTLQPAPIVYEDAEEWLATALDAAYSARDESYADPFVSNKVPNPRLPRMVIVRRDGGPTDGIFDQPRFGINVWADDEADCADLARLTVALLRTLPGDGVCVQMGEPAGPSRLPEESTQFRRYITVQARLRGTPLEES